MTTRDIIQAAVRQLTHEELEEYAVFVAVVLSKVGNAVGAAVIELSESGIEGYGGAEALRASMLSKKVRDACHRIQSELN